MFIRHRDNTGITIDTPAKINLYLRVLGRRPDGYHEISSLFQEISLYDTLALRVTDRPGIKLSLTNGVDLPVTEENLVVRAFRLMEKRFNFPHGVEAELTKRIPIAAGLGGGSSDAAATISACNQLFSLGLDAEQMAQLGLEIGSDVAFFFGNGQALVGGRGDVIEPADFPTDYLLAVVTPGVPVSTAEAYARLNLGLTRMPAAPTLSPCRSVGKLMQALRLSGNDFERAQFEAHPVLGEIRDALLEGGAQLARMSGSGPTMFGVFETGAANEVEQLLSRHPWEYYVVRPIDSFQVEPDIEGGVHGDN